MLDVIMVFCLKIILPDTANLATKAWTGTRGCGIEKLLLPSERLIIFVIVGHYNVRSLKSKWERTVSDYSRACGDEEEFENMKHL